MRFAFLLPVSVALGTAALIAAESRPAADRTSRAVPESDRDTPTRPVGRLEGISAYTDPDLAFDVAVPAGWTPIDVVEDARADPLEALRSGHAIGFEAPRDGPDDPFADYVMIEILPGRDSGLFLTDGSRSASVAIDGVAGVRDRLAIDGHEVGGVRLDLVVHQAEIRGLGWTIGFYAIGEAHREALVADAFELMIRTFRLGGPPFRVVRIEGAVDGAAPDGGVAVRGRSAAYRGRVG